MTEIIDNQQLRKLLQAYPAKAIEFLYECYYDPLRKLAMKLTQDAVVSEDIVQEAFIVIWENHKKLGEYHEKSIEHYLMRIVRNKSITHFKRKMMNRVSGSFPLNHANGQTVEKSVEVSIMEKEVSQNLRAMIATFPTRERECLLMRMYDEMSVLEIAHSMNVTVKAVERSLTSARKRLRKNWMEQNAEE